VRRPSETEQELLRLNAIYLVLDRAAAETNHLGVRESLLNARDNVAAASQMFAVEGFTEATA